MNEEVTRSPSLRRLPVGATYNLRDIGEYPARGGAQTLPGRLFRSDAARFTDGPDLAGLGLRTVVDLRDDREAELRPTGLDALVPAVLRRPLDPHSLLSEISEDSPDPLGELYLAFTRERGAKLAEIVTDLARPGALPALVHCAAGKDRTGVVIALVLSAIGVPDDVVAADYAITSTNLAQAFFDGLPAESVGADPGDEVLRGARPESMTTLLHALTAEYGTTHGYLVAHGVPDEAIDHLRTALTH